MGGAMGDISINFKWDLQFEILTIEVLSTHFVHHLIHGVWLSFLVSWSGRRLAVPPLQPNPFQVEECLESSDVVINNRKVLILNGTANLKFAQDHSYRYPNWESFSLYLYQL
jgi:hypothetical protein